MAKKTLVKPSAPIKKNVQKRKSIRYAPDPGTFALILSDENGKKLAVGIPCLIAEESYTGCGLITMKDTMIKKGATFEVQVGKLPKMQAQVRWTKILEDKIVYFGLSYQP
jgi:hypothetical protein